MQSGATQATINDAINIKLGNVVEKSLTTGLLKNDGTVDTNTYLQSGFSSSDANKNVVTDANGGLIVEPKPDLSGYASSTHTHGNITNDGKLSTTGTVDVSRGDLLLFADATSGNDQYKIKGASFTSALEDVIDDLITEAQS